MTGRSAWMQESVTDAREVDGLDRLINFSVLGINLLCY